MVADGPRDPRRRDVRRGLLSRSLTGMARAIQWLLFSLVFSIVVELVGMAFWWPEQGLEHSRDMLAAEIDYLQQDVGRSLISADPVVFARTLADRTYFVLFNLTGIERLVSWLSDAPKRDAGRFQAGIHAWLRPATEHAVAAMQVAQVFGVRLAVLLLATPTFGLFAVVGLVDGLVSRDLRRWGGGRESSFVYHWAKRATVPLLVCSWVAYLALPFSLHPAFMVLPFAGMFAVAVGVTASRFKKYL